MTLDLKGQKLEIVTTGDIDLKDQKSPGPWRTGDPDLISDQNLPGRGDW